jgi:hypothetical protein
VSELLDVDGRHWDYDKMRAVFNPADADALYSWNAVEDTSTLS